MPRNPNRFRPGMGHPRIPSQVQVSVGGGTPTGIKAPDVKAGADGKRDRGTQSNGRRHSVIPVSIVDAFYQMLPNPSIQQQAIKGEVAFSFFDVQTEDGLEISNIATRSQQVYIWTNLNFYALIPGDGMSAPPTQMDMHQLSGLLRFTLQIDNISPMNLITSSVSPYIDPLYGDAGFLDGWDTLDRDFGATRYGSAFALYARSGQRTRISMKAVDRTRPPRFVLNRIGYEINGYVASEADFDEVWRRTTGR
jgi:hypothetical protein